jgi:hypothetical protein
MSSCFSASGAFNRVERFLDLSPRLHPGITQEVAQREPKRPKGDDVRSADLLVVLCGALAPMSI